MLTILYATYVVYKMTIISLMFTCVLTALCFTWDTGHGIAMIG